MRPVRLGVSLLLVSLGTGALLAIVNTPVSLRQVDIVHDSTAEHVSQEDLRGLVAAGQGAAAFQEAFEAGDELFEAARRDSRLSLPTLDYMASCYPHRRQ